MRQEREIREEERELEGEGEGAVNEATLDAEASHGRSCGSFARSRGRRASRKQGAWTAADGRLVHAVWGIWEFGQRDQEEALDLGGGLISRWKK